MPRPLHRFVVIAPLVFAGFAYGKTPIEPLPLSADTGAVAYGVACATLETNRAAILSSVPLQECPNARTRAVAFCDDPLTSAAYPELLSLQEVAAQRCPKASAKSLPNLSPAPLLGAKWEEDFLNALAGMLVSRAKAEGLASLIEKLRDEVCKPYQGRKLFPAVCALVGTADPYRVPMAWSALRTAAELDLRDLAYRLAEVVLSGQSDKYKDAPEVVMAAADVLRLTGREGKDPFGVLAGLGPAYADAKGHCSAVPAQCSLYAFGILVKHVGPAMKAKAALPDPEKLSEIVARVVVEELKVEGFLDPKFDLGPETARLKATIRATYETFTNIKSVLEAGPAGGLPPDARKHAEHERMMSYARGIVDSLGLIGDLARSLQIAEAPASVERAVAVSRHLLAAIDAAENHDYMKAFLAALVIPNALGVNRLPDWFTKFVPFLVELGTAADAETMQKVLEAAAAPIGSWRSKRGEGQKTLSINGYVGLQGGYERLGAVNLPSGESWRGGLLGAVGVEASVGIGTASSVGLFFSVIDLGAVLDFRGETSTVPQAESGKATVTVEQQPSLGFAQVFSPGLHIVWGVPKAPVVVGGGFALTPALRRVNLEGGNQIEVPALRVGVFLAMDITLLSI